ncbi:MAG: PH domain-containing protein [Muribaculaceae bacterium]|nr:PH domain-containing protein [Muribaculaceae bacterium]
MVSKVKFSTYSLILSFILIALLVVIGICVESNIKFYFIFSLLFVLVMFACMCAPLRIEADDKYITVGSLLKKHKIALDKVVSVELFPPTMGARRLCGSGGFMGYWGIFREGDIGMYQAYYGRSSDCFLIRLKNGDKYVLGCNNPGEMVEYIKNRINNP